MEPPHLPTEILGESCARTSSSWSSPVPLNLEMTPQRALFQRLEGSVPRDRDWLADQSGFELSTPTSPFHRKIVREFGEEFAAD